MSTKNSALASLTATYTDSENEEKSDDESIHSDGDSSSQTRIQSRQQTPMRESSEASVTPPATNANVPKQAATVATATGSSESSTSRHKALRLVSYFDETFVSDDENVSPNREQENMDASDNEAPMAESTSPKKIDRAKLYGFSLPPETKGKCSLELQEKIATLYEKMRNSNMDTNKIIQERKEFRNPSIYEKLIQFCNINEFGTNYSPEIFDPSQWGKESFYEELAKAQKVEMEKVEKARKENAKTEIQVGVKKMDSDESKKRKSKWDQPGVLGTAPGAAGALKPAGIITQALTTTATGTKGTVISAFGTLPKKPKV
ncbi:SAP30-binding protein [Toxorhynchites rutilus septentrionalis]|uniref:SAP30-binding protein n=1 Tax=Toxorhynchites rutilus septentrionalis TaxID=329112 RepID=UPI00247AD8BA|nr:SAP30-binding protein [Toxorhynchites rutilus septentrionalis]